MPLEIGQLIINARIVTDNNTDRNTASSSTQSSVNNQKELIEQCIAEVLRILEQRQER